MSLETADFFLILFPKLVLWGVFGAAAFIYFFPERFTCFRTPRRENGYRALLWFTTGFRVFYAVLLTVGQYFFWSENSFSRSLLNTALGKSVPLKLIQNNPWLFNNRFGYFLIYSWGHFWLNAALSILLAVIFWQILALIKRRNDRFFDKGEVKLGFLSALLVGWPNVLLFVPVAFVFVVMISIIRKIFFREAYTTLGLPFLCAIFLTFLFGNVFLSLCDLSVFIV